MKVRALSLTWLLFAVAGYLAAQPLIERISPLGAQRGNAVRLTLWGEQLSQARLLSGIPGGVTPLSSASALPSESGETISYLVEIAADAPLGAYPLRVETADGISNLLLFSVGEFPRVEEAESADVDADEVRSNDFPELAQRVATPSTINGRLLGAERDLFRFEAKAGEKLVLEVEARRIGSAIDPHLEVLAADGGTLVRNADARGLGVDARLEFEFPADGEYIAAVHDERFSEQNANFYRLTIAKYSYADAVFPLGWRRGETVRAEFAGGNLKQSIFAEVDLASAKTSETWISVPGSPTRLPFLVGDDPEVLESEISDGALPAGTVVNGRIAAESEIDRYSLAVREGESWAVELRSGELSGSDLYGVLTISSGDEVLATAGRYAGDPSPYVTSTTGETSSYPFINLDVPPGVAELTVAVEDLLQRGGPAHSYRLMARRQGADFLATLSVPFVNIPVRGSAIVGVSIERRGYHGAVELSIEDAPDDVLVAGGHIPPTSKLGNRRQRFVSGTLTLTAKPGAKPGPFNLVVRATGVREDGSVIERRAAGPALSVAVAGKGQDAVNAAWLGYDLPARIVPAMPAVFEFLTPHVVRVVRGGNQHVVRWAVHTRADAGLAKKVVVPRDAGSVRFRVDKENSEAMKGEFAMFPHERTNLGMVDFNLSAEVRSEGRSYTVYSEPIAIEVVEGYGFDPGINELVIAAGESATWSGSIWRDPEFRQTVKVRAENLPVGVGCEPAELVGGATAFELRCSASAAVAAGDYDVEIQAESILSDEATTPYVVEPLTAALSITR